MEVKGDMVLKVSDPNKAHLKLAMDLSNDSNIQYKVRTTIFVFNIFCFNRLIQM